MSVHIPVTSNGAITLLTAGKYCPDNINVRVNVPYDAEQMPDFVDYADTIQDAINCNVSGSGRVGVTAVGDVTHICLYDDISTQDSIVIDTECVLHLNGHTLQFTAGAAYLNVTAKTTIDGKVPGSEITKSGVTYANSAKLVEVKGAHLTILGGKYSMANITSATFVTPIRGENATGTKIDMVGCEVVSSGTGSAATKCVQALCDTNIQGCELVANSVSSGITAVHTMGTLSVKNTNITVTAGGVATGIENANANNTTVSNCTIKVDTKKQGAFAVGINCIPNATTIITDCVIDVDGYSDVGDTIYSACAVNGQANSTVYINGGTYWGAREALDIDGTARIDGGVYTGCQHGGCYLSGSDVKVKNATFRNVEYTGDCGWSNSHFGAAYCGQSATANVEFDNCRFEAEVLRGNNYGLVVKGDTTNGAKVYISNSRVGDNFAYDLRVDGGETLYIGENVVYRQDAVLNNGTITFTGDSYGNWLDDTFG